MNYCEECGKPAERHHIIKRSQASYLVNVPINFKYLCSEHHRGNNGPHLCKKTDTKYRIELQKKLFEMFSKPYYRLKEIQEVLDISESEAIKIVKKIKLYKEGYDRLDIVLRCMGGRLIAT